MTSAKGCPSLAEQVSGEHAWEFWLGGFFSAVNHAADSLDHEETVLLGTRI